MINASPFWIPELGFCLSQFSEYLRIYVARFGEVLCVRSCKWLTEDYHLNEILKPKSLIGNQTKMRGIQSPPNFQPLPSFQQTEVSCSQSSFVQGLHTVCSGKLISITSLLLSFYAPYQFHPNNLQISFGFIYCHCYYFKALPTAA